MIKCHEIAQFVPVLVTESGNRLCRAVLHNRQVCWCKSGEKVNTHIGDAAFENERSAYLMVDRSRIPQLPEVALMEYNGRQWLVTTQAQGKRLMDIQYDLSKEEREIIENEIFSFVAILGENQGRFFGSLTSVGPHFASERALLEHMLQMHRFPEKCQYTDMLPVLEKLEAHNAFAPHPVLVHYDLWPGNIFYCAQTRAVTVIDLERCFYSDLCAEGASLLGMIEASVLEQRLCAGHPARIVKMYVYRILFLLERLDGCTEEQVCRNIRKQLDLAMDTLAEKVRIWEV